MLKNWLLGICLFPFTLLAGIPGPVSQVSISNATTFPQVAVDPFGNAFAVWTQFVINVSNTNQIFASRFNAATGFWSTPVLLGPGNFAKVGVDNSGNAIAVWVNSSPTQINTQILSSRFTTSGWSIPIVLTSTGINSSPVLAVSATGNAVALWSSFQNSLFPNMILGSTFNSATARWSSVGQVSSNGNLQQVSVNATNTTTAIWVNLTTGVIQSMRFTLP